MWLLKVHKTGNKRYAIFAAIAAICLGNIHTYDSPALIAIISAWFLIARMEPGYKTSDAENNLPEKVSWHAPALIISATVFAIAWQALVIHFSPEMAGKTSGWRMPAYPIADVLLTYSPLLPFCVVGIFTLGRNKAGLLPVIWLTVGLLIIYLPIFFAGRMVEGIHTPMSILAAVGLVATSQRIKFRFARLAFAGIALGLMCASTGFFVLWCIRDTQKDPVGWPIFAKPPVYLSKGDMAVLRYLDTVPPSGKVVLALPQLGNYVPQASGHYTM